MLYIKIVFGLYCLAPLLFIASPKSRIAAVLWVLAAQPMLYGLLYLIAAVIVSFPFTAFNDGRTPVGFAMLAAMIGAAIALIHGFRWLGKGMPGFPGEAPPVPPLNPMN